MKLLKESKLRMSEKSPAYAGLHIKIKNDVMRFFVFSED
ncbi:hypothetical protein VRK_14930 [Vibrio sp. MEBiC08052]|nr:hypothetical protein VRK_14930 [Vibrio sp. MEBiC08052]